jgi:adenylate cyclase
LKSEIHLNVLETLADAFATSIKQWIREERMWNYLGRLLPGHIVKLLKDHREKSLFEGPREHKVITILYADIRGYTAISEVVGEERLLKFVDDYYAMLARAVARTQGTLDKFMGDGVVALYGDVATLPNVYDDDKMAAIALDSLKEAVDAGLEIADKFRTLADRWVRQWRRECPQVGRNHLLEIGVLLHTGKPIVGLFHTGITESEGHITYTAIGRDMNLAARLCSRVDQDNVYVTVSAWELLKADAQFQFEDEPRIIRGLKGIPLELEIFKVSRKQ